MTILTNKILNNPNIWIFDGNDAAGKTSTANNVIDMLSAHNIAGVRIPFNLDPSIKPVIDSLKELPYDAVTNTLLALSSLSMQINYKALKELRKGKVVIIDRYIYSIVSRSAARGFLADGIIEDWIEYFGNASASVFYFDVEPNKALDRRSKPGERPITFWEAGLDIYSNLEKKEAFKVFQSRVRNKMISLLPKEATFLTTELSQEKKSQIIFEKVYETWKKSS